MAGNWKDKLIGGVEKTKEITKSLRIPEKLRGRSVDTTKAAAWVSNNLQKQGADFYTTLAGVTLSTYFLGNISALLLESLIPNPPQVRAVQTSGAKRARRALLSDYEGIYARNLFNSEGKIPGEDKAPDIKKTPDLPQLGGPAVRTSLPLNLVGTIILKDELRSLATIEDKSASAIYPVRVHDEVPSKIRILKIEARKVTFVNLSNRRHEFVDLPEDASVKKPVFTSTKPKVGTGIKKTADNKFNVSRNEINSAFKNLNQLLTQARAVPHFENGQPAGYKLFQIVPGSLYDKLGLKNGDTLCGINGETINNPARAFELLGELKTASHVELCVKRSGSKQNFAYDIN